MKVAPFILGLLVLAACNENDSSPPPTRSSTAVPMNTEAWSIRYSPGMPPHPASQNGGGWYFDFPTNPNSVHYVLAAVSMAASADVDANISVTTKRPYSSTIFSQTTIASIRPTYDFCCNRKATTYPEGMGSNTSDGGRTALRTN